MFQTKSIQYFHTVAIRGNVHSVLLSHVSHVVLVTPLHTISNGIFIYSRDYWSVICYVPKLLDRWSKHCYRPIALWHPSYFPARHRWLSSRHHYYSASVKCFPILHHFLSANGHSSPIIPILARIFRNSCFATGQIERSLFFGQTESANRWPLFFGQTPILSSWSSLYPSTLFVKPITVTLQWDGNS